MKDIHLFNFTSPLTCTELRTFTEINMEQWGIKEGRYKDLEINMDNNIHGKIIMQETINSIQKVMTKLYGGAIYSHCTLVKRPEGNELEDHEDVPFGEVAAITYLNDDFEGGQISIDDIKINIFRGLTVIFRGDKHTHKIFPVTKGIRYTLASWWEIPNP